MSPRQPSRAFLFSMDKNSAKRTVHSSIALTPTVHANTITVQIPVQPTRAGVIDERTYTFSVGRVLGIRGVRSFLGVDQGNAGEYALDLSCPEGRLYNRSMHKEAPLALYEAWERLPLPVRWNFPGGPKWDFSIHTVAHQTSPTRGNVQFEMILEVER